MDTANLPQAARAAIKSAVPSALLPLTLARSELREEAERSGFDAARFPGRVVSDGEPGRVVLKLDVLSVLVPETGAVDLAASLQPQLKRHGCQALVTAMDAKEFSYLFGDGVLSGETNYDKESLIVFFQADSPAPLLWVRGTNGANYDLDTGAILHRLEEWSGRCEFSLLGAGFDWLELRFQTLPVNLDEFAEEVYDFCPDTLDQGIVLPLPEQRDTLEETDFQEMETIVDWMEDAPKDRSTNDLANYLKCERRLYLWWD